jgi:NAD(P)-dependent dehydrogenase (short-subunit alcohol dehydrogenase family)
MKQAMHTPSAPRGTAIVTGAAGDIGQAIVQRLLDDGYRVCGWDHDNEGLAATAQRWKLARYLPVWIELLDTGLIPQAAIQSRTPAEPVTLLVNNAGGVSAGTSLRTTTEADYQHDIGLNLTAAWCCIQTFKGDLEVAGGGSIINIASINGLGVYGFPGYSVAKAGLLHLTRFAAVELGKRGIRVNAVVPGTVQTKAWDPLIANDPDILLNAAKIYPLRSVCQPEDVAGVVAFLASADARMVTGATLLVDGGISAGIDSVAGQFCQDPL